MYMYINLEHNFVMCFNLIMCLIFKLKEKTFICSIRFILKLVKIQLEKKLLIEDLEL